MKQRYFYAGRMITMLNQSLLECQVCKKVGGYPAMIRWHYNRKCKGTKS